MKRRITVFTRETFERVTIPRPESGYTLVWCAGCGAEAEMAAGESGARLSGVSSRSVYRLVEAGLVHFSETPDGGLLVCLASLSERLAAPPRGGLTAGES